MPELPEVETLCRQLNAIIPGKRIIKVEVLDPLLGHVEGLAGRRIAAVARRGKAIEIRLEGEGGLPSAGGPEERQPKGRRKGKVGRAGDALRRENSGESGGHGGLGDVYRPEGYRESGEHGGMDAAAVEIHLRMTGRLFWQDEAGPPPPHTRLIVSFPTGRLLLIDPRRFATFRVRAEAPTAALIENPLEGLPAGRLREIARTRQLPVKNLLMDQRLVAGIGNIYACEILHEAAIDPCRPACSLAPGEWRRVEKAAAAILPRAVECRGTTVSDWRDLFGASGTNQDHLRVYAREGGACPRCGGRIGRAKLAGRGTWFCQACQK